MAESAGEKTHDPTPHRREEARKKGQVATSQDLGSATLLIAGVLILMTMGGTVLRTIRQMIEQQVGGEAWLTVDRGFLLRYWHATLMQLAQIMLPVLVLLFLAAVLVNLAQVGFLFAPERVTPDWSRINPVKGLQRLFSLTGLMRLGFGLFKVLVIATVAALAISGHWQELLAVSRREPAVIGWFMIQTLLWTSLKIGVALLVLALLDYAYQRWKHEQDLRMTHQEIREELKTFQGDPQILARRRAVQRQLALGRLSDTVPKADVVITNPTELAIAIQYDPQEMAAPIVVAKGAGVIAQRIRQLALEHQIPIVEKKPLARALYKEVDVHHPIPDQMYAAVAEVLAYVYRLKGKPIPGTPDT